MFPTKHILIIDNDPISRRLFGSLLGRVGFEILYAKDGREGYETAKAQQPDLILLDLHMPGVDGIETAGMLRRDPESVKIPIILLSNEDLSFEAQGWMKGMGIRNYIQKGVGNDEFVELVKKFFNTEQQNGLKPVS